MRHTYRHSAVRPKKSTGIHPMWVGLFLVLIIIIVVLVGMLLKHKPEEVTVTDGLLQETTTESNEASASTQGTADTGGTSAAQPFEETDLYFVGDGYAGFARRGIENGVFTAAVVTSMPSIDLTTHYYEVWFVKPGITGYFSGGEMFARADGKFGLVYEVDTLKAPADILDYSDIVITREIRDNDTSPSATHIVEGGF